MTHTLNTARTAAVSIDAFWLPINDATPLGVKMLLISKQAGIATVGEYRKCDHFDHWFPLPRFRLEWQWFDSEDDGL